MLFEIYSTGATATCTSQPRHVYATLVLLARFLVRVRAIDGSHRRGRLVVVQDIRSSGCPFRPLTMRMLTLASLHLLPSHSPFLQLSSGYCNLGVPTSTPTCC
jgi:hypothetical protein